MSSRLDEATAEAPVMRRPAVFLVAAATILVLGLNWPLMAVGVATVPVLWLTAIRMFGGALVVAVALSFTGGVQRPPRADYSVVASVALVRLALVTALVFSALRFVPPGRSSILVYTSALWTVPLAALFLKERLTGWRVAGLIAGCAGVVVLVEPWALEWSEGRTALGYGMLLAAAVATAAGTVHIRGHRWTATALELMPWQQAGAGVVCAVLALAVEGLPAVTWSMATVGIVLYQAFLASAFGVWGFVTMSRSLPAISTNLTLMAVPAIGLASSVLFVGEPLTVGVVAGLLLILGGAGAGVLSAPAD